MTTQISPALTAQDGTLFVNDSGTVFLAGGHGLRHCGEIFLIQEEYPFDTGNLNEWQPDKYYVVGEVICSSGGGPPYWVSTTDHWSPENEGDVNMDDWEEVWKVRIVSAVSVAGINYHGIGSGETEFNAKWFAYKEGGAVGDTQWEQEQIYNVGDVVWKDGNAYQCKLYHESSDANAPPDDTYWVWILAGLCIVAARYEGKVILSSEEDLRYCRSWRGGDQGWSKGDICFEDDKFWKCKWPVPLGEDEWKPAQYFTELTDVTFTHTNLLCIDLATKEIQWHKNFGDQIVSMDDDGDYIYISRRYTSIDCYDFEGSEQWRYESADVGYGLVVDGGTVYTSKGDYQLHLNSSNGNDITPENTYEDKPPAIKPFTSLNNRLVGGRPLAYYQLDADDGWEWHRVFSPDEDAYQASAIRCYGESDGDDYGCGFVLSTNAMPVYYDDGDDLWHWYSSFLWRGDISTGNVDWAKYKEYTTSSETPPSTTCSEIAEYKILPYTLEFAGAFVVCFGKGCYGQDFKGYDVFPKFGRCNLNWTKKFYKDGGAEYADYNLRWYGEDGWVNDSGSYSHYNYTMHGDYGFVDSIKRQGGFIVLAGEQVSLKKHWMRGYL